MTFGGRRPLVEDNLRWKTNFSGSKSLVEDDLRWKTTFGKRRPVVKDNRRWKTTIGGRRPSVEDNLKWNMTFLENYLSGRQPSVEDDIRSARLNSAALRFSNKKNIVTQRILWVEKYIDYILPCMMPSLLCGNFIGPNFFWSKSFLDKTCFWPDFFRTFFRPICHNPNSTSTQKLGLTWKWLHTTHPPTTTTKNNNNKKNTKSNISSITDPILNKGFLDKTTTKTTTSLQSSSTSTTTKK